MWLVINLYTYIFVYIFKNIKFKFLCFKEWSNTVCGIFRLLYPLIAINI
jgi:hypothetical protein